MVDSPQVPPPAYELVIAQKLLQCGLTDREVTVKYENELQSIAIVIGKSVRATVDQLDCIRQAAGDEIVIFNDPKLQEAYQGRVFEEMKPKMLADARAELDRRGVLVGFPERSHFDSDKLFAEALERQCGLKPGSFFVESRWGLIGQPKLGRHSKVEQDRMACLMTAITYASAMGWDFKFGFIGNEAIAPRK